MHRFYFSVVYDGVPYPDDRGDLFSTPALAEAHAVQIANELGRNKADAVSVTVCDESGVTLGRVINAMKSL
jgi:hypothetical protein